MAGIGQRARKHDVAIENRTCGVGNGVLLVVAFSQDGVERRDRAAAATFYAASAFRAAITGARAAVAGALHQLRQLGEHGRRVTLGGRRLADGKRNFTLRHRVARERIHDQQHLLATVAKMFGNRRSVGRALQAQEWRHISGRGDHNGAFETFCAKIFFNEGLDLTATLADQPDHRDVGTGIARQHAEQHAFADAAASEEADALTAPDCQQRVDRAHADVNRFVN